MLPPNLLRILLLPIAALALSACDPAETPAAPGCTGETAAIGVGDAYLEILCGCQEQAGQYTVAPDTLTCTVPAGTAIVFHYLRPRLSHQIGPVGTPAIPVSPLYNPKAERPIYSHSFVLSTPGTYQFQDFLNSAMAGEIVVQ